VHRSREELEAGVAEVRRSPKDGGRLALIVCRPAIDERQILDVGALDLDVGLVGDNWRPRGSKRTADGSAHPDKQVTVMNARAAALMAGAPARWAEAGDQLYVDFDLSGDNAPAGTRLAIGAAVIEITDQPHLGCAKFAARFGREAVRFVNSAAGVALNLRGVNARVVVAGSIRTGDRVAKVERDAEAVAGTGS
jgi:MOSC domain-containing protein YiiM